MAANFRFDLRPRRRLAARQRGFFCAALLTATACLATATAEDHIKQLQQHAASQGRADWGHWGPNPAKYSSWSYHTNRLVPIYTFGIDLDVVGGSNNIYHDVARLEKLYGRVPENTLNAEAAYFDQTAVFDLQQQAAAAGKKYIVLIVFDGLDWQTTQAAAIHCAGEFGYTEGRGSGLAFQDYAKTKTDFGFFVTSPYNDGTGVDPDAQTTIDPEGKTRGGFDPTQAGHTPWDPPSDPTYLVARNGDARHAVTDSASSATSMTSGIKTYNDAINVDPHGRHVIPIARRLQERGFAVGVVTSVPASHATPGSAYANNVSRHDFQDISRDLLGLPSVAHRSEPLKGVDVLIGAGVLNEIKEDDPQGDNFAPGNRYVADHDLRRIDATSGGQYVIARRTSGENGSEILANAAKEASQSGKRLFGYFGVLGGIGGGHLPYQTADGRYDPVRGAISSAERYDEADLEENPTLAEMTRAALTVLQCNPDGFWLMIESGDVDWANHDNNIDNSIGAVLSGDEAFRVVTDWAEAHDCWDETAVIVTADHGHYLVLTRPEMLLPDNPTTADGGR